MTRDRRAKPDRRAPRASLDRRVKPEHRDPKASRDRRVKPDRRAPRSTRDRRDPREMQDRQPERRARHAGHHASGRPWPAFRFVQRRRGDDQCVLRQFS